MGWGAVLAIGFLFAGALPLAAMPLQGLWLDETNTVFIHATKGASFREFLAHLSELRGSYSFTLPHTVAAAAWARGVPFSEFGMRVFNLPFLFGMAALVALWIRNLGLRGWGVRVLFSALVGLSPFWVYYAIEFRPYAAMIFFGGMLHYGLSRLETGERGGAWLAAGAFTLAFLNQPTAVLVLPLVAFGLLAPLRRDPSGMLHRLAWPSLVAMLPLAAGGLYYVWVLRQGKMAAFGNPPDLKNALYAAYEFMGFAGLGPSREVLRSANPLVVEGGANFGRAGAPHVALCVALLLAWAWFVAENWRARRRMAVASPLARASLKWSFLLAVGGGSLMLVYFHWKEYRYLPRHLGLVFMPFMLGVATAATEGGAQVRGEAAAALPSRGRVAWVLAALLAVSSLRLALVPSYGRDDYRGFFRWAEAEVRHDPRTTIWCAMQVFPPLCYLTAPRFVALRGGHDLLLERTGRGAYREMAVDGGEGAGVGNAFTVLLEPSVGQLRALEAAAEGRRVLVALNRGGDFDLDGRVRGFLKEKGVLHPVATFRFISVYEWIPPSQRGSKGGI